MKNTVRFISQRQVSTQVVSKVKINTWFKVRVIHEIATYMYVSWRISFYYAAILLVKANNIHEQMRLFEPFSKDYPPHLLHA